MILHITFTDGSNPWVTFGDSKKCLKAWRRWEKVPEARPEFWENGLKCRPVFGGGWAVGESFIGPQKCRHYARLGNALNYIEKQRWA